MRLSFKILFGNRHKLCSALSIRNADGKPKPSGLLGKASKGKNCISSHGTWNEPLLYLNRNLWVQSVFVDILIQAMLFSGKDKVRRPHKPS